MTVATSPSPASERLALAGVLLTVFLWGANVVALKAVLGVLNAETTNTVRVVIAGTVLVALAVQAHGWPRWKARTWLAVGGVGLLGNTLFQAFFLTGIELNPAGVAGLVNGLVPVLVLPLGLLLGQRFTRCQGLGVAVAFAGLLGLLALTRLPGVSVTPTGLLWLLAAGLVWALYTLFNRPLSARLGTLPFVAFSLTLGSVPYLLYALPHLQFSGPTGAGVPGAVWLGIGFSALGANVAAYLAWAGGAQVLGAARTSVWQALAPVITILLSAALLRERLPISVWGMAAVILIGATLANWPEPGRASRSLKTEGRFQNTDEKAPPLQ
ncbi:EamA family transporter [Deinococcus humi]|uniref:Drug/metabolite transporter (DMT)-like permease n=1 Tax=Deinococcus humi TaxID=662880 RepID=A0A7W8JRN2_9DEIO|nr:drug/metabolite transporter (DMT)-like permease [Deinococcus humi]